VTKPWIFASFDDVFVDVSGGQRKTKTGAFLASGRYPLIDQGKDLVGGYTDDPEVLCTAELPIVVFGDHTRAVKYVDFSFGVGADGVKLLRPRRDDHVPYLFRFLEASHIPAAGYDRHFKYLKRLIVPLPPIEEQRRIAAVLDQADVLRTKRQTSLVVLDTLNESMFVEVFGDPSMWARVERPLIDLVDSERPISYGILKPGPQVESGVRYVRVVDMRLGGVDVSATRRTALEISHQYRRSLLKPGDLLLSIRGHVGRLAEVPPELDGANITQDSARLAITGANPRFVLQFLRTSWAQGWMERNVKGAAVRGINLSDVKRLPVPVFDRSAQDEFVRRARTAERTELSQRRSSSNLNALFSSIQHRAFAGQL